MLYLRCLLVTCRLFCMKDVDKDNDLRRTYRNGFSSSCGMMSGLYYFQTRYGTRNGKKDAAIDSIVENKVWCVTNKVMLQIMYIFVCTKLFGL